MIRQICLLVFVAAGGGASFLAPEAFGQVVVPTHGTYMGGTGVDRLQDVHFGSNGKVYSCGNTKSGAIQFPALVPGDDHSWGASGANDGIALITSQDFQTVYAWTYIGGTGDDRAYAIRTDDQGFVYVYGFTESAAWAGPTFTGARDMFVIRYDSNLENPRPTFLGGTGGANNHQGRNSMFVYGNGEVLISGGTDCTNYPVGTTPLPGREHRAQSGVNPGNFDAFLTKLDTNGAVAWNAFLGSDGDESAYSGVTVDSSGAIYIAGSTNLHIAGTSNPPQYWPVGLPTSAGSFQATYQGGTNSGLRNNPAGDGFVARFTAAGSLSWVTYLGGTDIDSISGNDGLHVASDGAVYVVGATKSDDFPRSANTPPGYDPPPPLAWTHTDPGVTNDGFVTNLFSTPTSTGLNRSTLIGGVGNEELGGVEVDYLGRVHFVGNTTAPTAHLVAQYPTTGNAYQPTKSGYGPGQGGVGLDGLYTMLDADLSVLIYSTYMGSMSEAAQDDRGRALDLLGRKVFIAGDTSSQSIFPAGTALGFQMQRSTPDDGFLARFTW